MLMIKDINIRHKNNTWQATVKSIKKTGNCFELRIESRSGITLLVGKYSAGWFACLPDFGVGAGLSQFLCDEFYNTEALTKAGLNEIDATTIAQVLKQLNEYNLLERDG